MRPERAAVLLLMATLLIVATAPAVSGAGGPPEHANADATSIKAADKKPVDDVTAPRKSASAPGQIKKNNGKTTPQVTPTPVPSSEILGEEMTETPTGRHMEPQEESSRTAGAQLPGPTGIVLGLTLLAGAAVLGARYLKQPEKRGPHGASSASTIVLQDPNRTVLPHPAGFPRELSERYDRITFVGRGGLGQVFSAVRRDDGRPVAVKVPVAYDEATGKTFLKEMRFWEELAHPNIVQVYSVNILPVPYVEMEYLPQSLTDLDKPLLPKTAARIAAGILAGLAYAHKPGIVHRDIKPGNILLAEDLTPKIADWGMSTRPEETRENGTAGFTLAYAAPEQIAPEQFGRTGPATDIYLFGVVFYEMVTGKLPYASEGIAGITGAILNAQPAPPSDLDPALARFDEIILRCLAKTPTDRYQSAGEALDAIETVVRETGYGRA